MYRRACMHVSCASMCVETKRGVYASTYSCVICMYTYIHTYMHTYRCAVSHVFMCHLYVYVCVVLLHKPESHNMRKKKRGEGVL